MDIHQMGQMGRNQGIGVLPSSTAEVRGGGFRCGGLQPGFLGQPSNVLVPVWASQGRPAEPSCTLTCRVSGGGPTPDAERQKALDAADKQAKLAQFAQVRPGASPWHPDEGQGPHSACKP